MILAYLLLLTGLTISAVAIYYSVVGLAAIFSAAVVPIIVMGSALEVAKLVCASWLKANWARAPKLMKLYMTIAVIVLMIITSMGIFGFLSKAHSDQSLVSGDVMSKISVYDEKIKTAKENIDANRKALKQMDEAVDQVMGRSQDEKGADKAVAIRRGQAKERTRLLSEITAEQKTIAQLSEERAPIAAEVRKVEAEVGPLKYIAAFVYGATDESILEKAVTWVIITIIVVFDPLAVIMLLAAQMTFAWHRNGHDPLAEEGDSPTGPVVDIVSPEPTVTTQQNYEPDDGPLTPTQVEQLKESVDLFGMPTDKYLAANDVTWPETHIEEVPEVDPNQMVLDFNAPDDVEVELAHGEELLKAEESPDLSVYDDERLVSKFDKMDLERPGDYLTAVTGDRIKPDLTEVIEPEESKKKSYMTKDELGRIITRTRE